MGIELPGLPSDGLLADNHVLSGQDHATAGDGRELREERRDSLTLKDMFIVLPDVVRLSEAFPPADHTEMPWQSQH